MMNNRGQTTLPEYVLILFVVLAFAVAITLFAQRGLQARIHDARDFAIKTIKSECVDGSDCIHAIPEGRISREYEPYYGNITSNTDRQRVDNTGIEGGVAQIEGIYHKFINEETSTVTESRQKPPKDAQQ